MAEKGIIFSAPMVRALLDERKTQTRRLIQPTKKDWGPGQLLICEGPQFGGRGYRFIEPYAPGDRLYVRETWRVSPDACEGWHPQHLRGWIDYQSSGSAEMTAPSFDAVERAAFLTTETPDWDCLPSRYRPCIHMPRWVSRLWLGVTEVRVQRLQDISEDDAIAEGVCWQEPTPEDRAWAKAYAEENGGDDEVRGVWTVPGTDCGFGPKPRQPLWGTTAVNCYAYLWDSLHTEPGTRWADNPWVVAVSFDVHPGNIDAVPQGDFAKPQAGFGEAAHG